MTESKNVQTKSEKIVETTPSNSFVFKNTTPFVDKCMSGLYTIRWLVYGGIAGSISRTATAPLERLKVLKQVQHMKLDAVGVTAPRYIGILPALKHIYAEEGFRGYFKGNMTNIVRIIPSDATRFYSYDIFKRWLFKEGEMTAKKRVMAGALAGMTSTLLTFPLDMVRTRLTVQTSSKYRGIVHCAISIIKEEGFLGLYKGLGTSMLGIAPYVAINFATYETIKQKVIEYTGSASISPFMGVWVGATAGTAAVAITYPTDVVRRRMMMRGTGGGTTQYTGLWDVVRSMLRTEGVTSFYHGLGACFLKVVPSTAISWFVIERLKNMEKHIFPNNQ